MQFVALFTPDAHTAKGPPSPDHMTAMMDMINKQLASGTLLASGALGFRDRAGARLTRKDGKVTVEEAPKGAHALFGAGGFSILNASNREEAIAEVKASMATMGDGVCEVLGFAFPLMTAAGGPAPKLPPMGGVIPYLTIEGAAKAADFYLKAFGARETMRMPAQDGQRLMHCHLEINGGSLMMSDAFAEHGHPYQPSESYTMQLVVADADVWWKRAVDAGCTVTMPLEKQFWGDRYGKLKDPFGVTWAINEPAQK